MILRMVLLAGLALGALAGRADAAFTITFAQVGNDVVVAGTGSLNLAGLSINASQNYPGFIVSEQGTLVLGPRFSNIPPRGNNYLVNFSNRAGFGTGSNFFPDSGTESAVGMFAGFNILVAPVGYVSGASLSSSSTYNNQTFASMGLIAGTYLYSYAAPGSTTVLDSITVVIPGVVPEPASLAMVGVALAGVGLIARRTRRD